MDKVRIDRRLEATPKPQVGDQLELEDAIRLAGWSDDPGSGIAVLLDDGREVFSPLKFEEPADIEAGQDMMAVLEKRIIQRLQRDAGLLRGDDEVDETAEEANDFDVRDEVEYVSGFEIEMATEFPQMPTPAPRPGRDPDVAEEAELSGSGPGADRGEGSLDDAGDRESEAPAREPAKRASVPPRGGDEGGNRGRERPAVPPKGRGSRSDR